MPSIGSPLLWIAFVAFVLVMLALDLGVFHRKAHVVKPREALVWSLVWIALALGFNVLVWGLFGAERATQFLTGYFIEKSLSIDNIFVFVVIFSTLGIPAIHQHRVLFWGILSALVMRAVMIFAGAAMLARFHWLIYVFGAFLVITGVKLFLQRNAHDSGEDGWAVKLVRRVVPSTNELHGERFTVRQGGRLLATPLLVALLLVEISDVIFAVDSIPAIFAVTTDPFIVFTSNIFAILGLRSLYFLLAGLVDKFAYLKVALATVLMFVGAKMTLVDVIKIPALVSLGVIAALLGGAVVLSLLTASRREGQRRPVPMASPDAPAP